MNFTPLLLIFFTVFFAELGDKTQLATILFASDREQNPWLVFTISSLALVTSTAFAVIVGSFAAKHLELIPLKLIAGVGFVLIGFISIYEHFTS